MNDITRLPNREALLIAQIKDFKVKLKRDMDTYQKLLLLNLEMADVLAQYKQHHDLVQQWTQLARELIAFERSNTVY